MRSYVSWLAAGLLSFAGMAEAQQPVVATPPAAPDGVTAADNACELHVWPAEDIKAVTQGWVLNNTVNQDFNLAKGGFVKPDTLTPARQVALLKDVELPRLLALPSRTVVVHDAPLTRAQAASPERNAQSGSTCYAELVVNKLFYDRAPMAGRSLKTMIVYRTFDASPTVAETFATWAETSLTMFPAATPDQVGNANVELANAYQANLRLFARYALAPKKEKKRRS